MLLNLLISLIKDLIRDNRSTYRAFALVLCISNTLYSAEGSDSLTNKHVTRKSDVNMEPAPQPQPLKRIREIGGEVLIDGSMRVLEPLYMSDMFDMVEISTPVTPSSNHARIFLRADGTKSSVVIIFDDGTTTKIVGN